MTIENYARVRVSPSGPIIASQGGFSNNRTWMWQGAPSDPDVPEVSVPGPDADYAEGLDPAAGMLVQIKPYEDSGLVYNITVDMIVQTVSSSGGVVITVVGSNDDFATSVTLAVSEYAVGRDGTGLGLGESVQLHDANMVFSASTIPNGIKQVAVLLQAPSEGISYTPADVAFVIEEYGTD